MSKGKAKTSKINWNEASETIPLKPTVVPHAKCRSPRDGIWP